MMRTLLICHRDEPLNLDGLSRWMASFSQLTGIVVLDEASGRLLKRIRREIRRVGLFRFADVLAFRLYYRLFLGRRDRRWEKRQLVQLHQRYPEPAYRVPVLHAHSPNSPEAESFIRAAAPDIVIARCKTLLKESVFTIPPTGAFVMHPGICPEYRNAHGCFWALAHDDLAKVGMTLLRIDKGVDTGPVYGYFRCAFDEVRESHVVIQARTVFDNLDALSAKLKEIHQGQAARIDTTHRASGEWGQPWLTSHLAWKYKARRRARLTSIKGDQLDASGASLS